jgi:hypothetical protein
VDLYIHSPNTPSWRGSHLKHRNNFTFYLFITSNPYEVQKIKEILLLLSLAPQPSLGLGLLHKIQLNFVEASQKFYFLQGRIVSPTPNPLPEDQAFVFITPRGMVATHFSRLLRHAWVTVGLFLFPGHHTGIDKRNYNLKTSLSIDKNS